MSSPTLPPTQSRARPHPPFLVSEVSSPRRSSHSPLSFSASLRTLPCSHRLYLSSPRLPFLSSDGRIAFPFPFLPLSLAPLSSSPALTRLFLTKAAQRPRPRCAGVPHPLALRRRCQRAIGPHCTPPRTDSPSHPTPTYPAHFRLLPGGISE